MSSIFTIGIFHDGISVPPKEGISVHVYELARALADQRGVRVILVNADRRRATEEQLAEEPFDTLLLPPDDYYDQHKIATTIEEYNFDIVQNYNTYYIASILGPAAERCSIPLIAEHHDLESELTFLRSDDENDHFHQDCQRIAIEYSARSRFMSSHNLNSLARTLPPTLAKRTFSMPVAFAPSPTPIRTREKNNTCAIFIGNMSYQPNYDAALAIINHIAPRMPRVKFMVVGRGSKDLPLRNDTANVELLGEVDDLRSVLTRTSIGLAPLSMGSGLKIKLITYLEAGIPIVCSSIAAHGFPQSPAIHIARSWDEYAEHIQLLLSTRNNIEEASRAARGLFRKYFDISRTLPHLLQIYRDSVENYHTPSKDLDAITLDMSQFPWHNELIGTSYVPLTSPRFIKGSST